MEKIERAEIEKVLDEEVRPKLLLHQGDVEIAGWKEGILQVKLTGHCAGCPSAMLTTEEIIETVVKKRIPEIKKVILVNEVSEELIDMAKKLMGRHRA